MRHDLKMHEKFCLIIRKDEVTKRCPVMNWDYSECERFQKELELSRGGWLRLKECKEAEKQDASLIAAAPEMLEMLKELLNCWEEKGGFNTTRISKIFASGKINELLKKVEEPCN